MIAGTMVIRIRNASMVTATARPRPNSLITHLSRRPRQGEQ
jgi:hypothetical protein